MTYLLTKIYPPFRDVSELPVEGLVISTIAGLGVIAGAAMLLVALFAGVFAIVRPRADVR